MPVAVEEWKDPSKLRTPRQRIEAGEQAAWHTLALQVRVAVVTDGQHYRYLDAVASAEAGALVDIEESRDLTAAVLEWLLAGGVDTMRDPKPPAESVWLIWHAAKAEPKECLLTF